LKEKTTHLNPASSAQVMNSWILLVLAGLLEICWALGLKSTDGFTRLWPSVFVGGALVASLVLLSIAVKQLPIGTAYAVWVGIGAAGAAVAAVFLNGETMTLARAAFLGLLLVSIIGLKLTSTAH
jgi:quaternary ammonium compound-resistance protein SugE